MVLLIISAFSWVSDVSWFLGITLTTNPSVAQISDEDGIRSIPFQKIDETVYINTTSNYDNFEIFFDTENRGVKFEGEDSGIKSLPGAIAAVPGSLGRGAYIPLCDVSNLSVKYYRLIEDNFGHPTALEVQGERYSTPWRPFYLFQSPWNSPTSFNGLPLLGIMLNENGHNYFLSNSEVNEWIRLDSIKWRAVISGVNRSTSNNLAKRIIPDEFYGRDYYYDFEVPR